MPSYFYCLFEVAEEISKNYSLSRLSFETLDENNFGSICCLLILFCAHFTLFSKNKLFYSISLLIIFYAVFLTVSRTVTTRLIIQTLVYLSISGIFSKKIIIGFTIIFFPIIIILFINNPFTCV